jgi:uncharacterized SAM-binding protein YcdF (DUF218 family)
MRSFVAHGFLAPPALFISICVLGALAALVWPRIGITIALASSLCLFAVATPALSSYLTRQLESEIPTSTDLSGAQAIVVLGADVQSTTGNVPDRLGPLSLERLVFAADAYDRLHLPVVLSGGQFGAMQPALAELMKVALERYFKVPVTWTENKSHTTYENAFYTARLLRDQHIHTIVVVTQARDLPRAIWSFERVGLRALPWIVPHTPLDADRVEDFLPDSKSFQASFFAVHELLGIVYYRLRY